MSLSADKNAEVALFGTMPERLFPVFGPNAKAERKEIRSSYPSFVEGKRQLIPDADRNVYQYWQALASYAEGQKDLAVNLIRYGLGDAEYGTTANGLVFVSRRRVWFDEVRTPAGFRDGIYPERN